MSYRTIETCQHCGHEGEALKRRVVVCDQCGKQANLVYCEIVRDQVPPREAGWSSGFFCGMGQDGKSFGTANLCSTSCGQAWSKTHERARVMG